MKIQKAYRVTLLITALAFGTQVMAAGDPMVEKKKTYSKSYAVSNSDKISLSNQFGEMKISTWDKGEVKVDVTITTEAGSDERAQQLLDIINIQDGKSGSGVYFKTKIGNNNNNDRGKGEKQSFHIDYVVYVPASGTVDARNEFGPLSIGDFKGKIWLESKFGSLTAGNLSGEGNVNVEFGKATIGSMVGGSLTIKFSRGLVNNLSGDVKANFEHSSVKLGVENDLKNIDIKNSFTQLYLDVNTNLSANFDISTSFCDVKNKTSFDIKKEGDDDDRSGPKFDFHYSGKAGSGNTRVRVKASFGDVTIGHNIDFDVNADDKKRKEKTRNI
ncbi:hypothetical protein D3H65_30735 [Paraflavitalea soli]|uniref:Adhesin domain-containing protein n=1 Tax=Paraflavitalea soli TaxID=2315862 RepID=A0A3B7MU87_9BACT|nr:hypothetical protein [Paraflavitalea soli]AXY78104.1 hypothetical protein D3H65_30735 [Paraflavitalea soli]